MDRSESREWCLLEPWGKELFVFAKTNCEIFSNAKTNLSNQSLMGSISRAKALILLALRHGGLLDQVLGPLNLVSFLNGRAHVHELFYAGAASFWLQFRA